MTTDRGHEKAVRGGHARPEGFPRDPVAAVTHPDPYGYYTGLVAKGSVYRDETLGLWVAADAADITSVMTSERCGVRPPAEPVPKQLAGAPAGEVFGRLVRMREGADHRDLKPAISAALDGFSAQVVAAEAARWAADLAAELELGSRLPGVNEFMFRLPGCVIATLLGFPREALGEIGVWVGALARCFAPGSAAAWVPPGNAAAERLLDRFRTLLVQHRPASSQGLLGMLAQQIAGARQDAARDESLAAANGIGFLFQAHDATAGLIGNALLALAAHREWLSHAASPAGLERVVREVLRHDPPVHNTRRFVHRPGIVAGQPMQTGDAILVVLAAANRDPAANPDPHRFDPARSHPRSFTFGLGAHACPGEAWAVAIACAGVAALLRAGVDPARLAESTGYLPSANTRIPLFGPP